MVTERSRSKAGPYLALEEKPAHPVETRPGTASSALVGEAATLLGGSLDETLRAIAGTAQRSLGADRATCYVISEEERVSGVHTTESDPEQRRFLESSLGVEVTDLPIWKILLGDSDPLFVIEDIGRTTMIGDGLRSKLGAGAIMGVRLEHESIEREGQPELLGAVLLSFREPRPIGPAERAAARGLANLAGLAIGNARLRDQALAHLAEAQQRADTDELTDLPNRRGLEERLRAALSAARDRGEPASFLVLDLDNFRRVNVGYGHGAGDAALRLVARTLEAGLRPGDVAGRTGGEEFLIILPGTGSRGAWLVAERMRAALGALGGGAWLLTVSIGVACYPEHGTEAGELLRAAESAMYDAKRLGRDRSIVFEPLAARDRSVRAAHAQEENEDHLRSVIALAEAIDARDPSTYAHSRTVGGLAARIADRLGRSGERVEEVRVAGLLHDIGKVAVPDAILHKRGPLLDSEWRQVRRHPEVGSSILIHRMMGEIREWVLRHHERPDGKGYPGGLTGDAIPVEARILAVADAYEAMISDRPYRRGMDPAAAQAELARCCGTQFDGAVVDAFLSALREDL
jgi:diguanylate cyclase (GGDEF)-like protein/putative nucleotidyltransferase with HDIG domain